MSTQVICDAVLGSTLTLRLCSEASYDPAETVEPVRATGLPDVIDHDVTGGEPKFEWTTNDIAGLVGGMSMQVGLFVPDTDATGVQLASRARAGASFVGGAAEGIRRMKSALIIPQSITASEKQNASATLMAYGVSVAEADPVANPAGLVDPVELIAGAAPASGAATRYAFGGVIVTPTGGAAIRLTRGVSFTVNTGITATPRSEPGMIYPDEIEVETREPTIELQFQSNALLNTINGGDGFKFSSLQVLLYPRTGRSLDPGNAITFSFSDGYAQKGSESGSGTSPIQPSYTCRGESPLVVL